MNILVIGSGGREHAIIDAIARSPKNAKIYAAPGNAGIAQLAECINIKDTDVDGVVVHAPLLRRDLELARYALVAYRRYLQRVCAVLQSADLKRTFHVGHGSTGHLAVGIGHLDICKLHGFVVLSVHDVTTHNALSLHTDGAQHHQ